MGIVSGNPVRGSSSRNRDLARDGRRKRFTAIAWRWAALCAALSMLPLGGSVVAKEAVSWIESYDEALLEARRTGKPIFLEFRCAP